MASVPPSDRDLNIRKRRLAVELSQEGLARQAECSLSMVRLVERGYRPGPDLAERLDAVLREHEAAA